MGSIKELRRKRRGRAFRHDYVDHNGKRHRELIEVDTIKEAEEIASMVEAQVAEVKRGLRSPPQAKTEWKNFKMRVLIYYEQQKTWNTTLRMKYSLENAERILKPAYIQDISSTDIEQFKGRRLKEVSASTVSIELRGLKAAFNVAKKWGIVNINPVVGVGLPKVVNRTRRLFDSEVTSLLDNIDDPEYKDLILTYLHTGARRSGILPPKFGWENVNWEEKTLTIHGKGDKTRWIPMNETVEGILQRRRDAGEESPFNFRPDSVTHAVKRYMRKAGIENASTKTLRNTFGSRLLETKAADIYEVSRLLGHSSVIVTERHYIDILDENYHRAVRSLDSNNPPSSTPNK